MNDQDTIKAGVELADGFEWDELKELNHSWVRLPQPFGIMEPLWVKSDEKFMLDAVAAQLVRQVDKQRLWQFNSDIWGAADMTHRPRVKSATRVTGQDRTMNTIKAIVDSKALEK